MNADRRFQFSLAALFKLTLISAVLVVVIPPDWRPALAWGAVFFTLATLGAASFFIAMVLVYETVEAGFWIIEIGTRLYRRAVRVAELLRMQG